MKTSNDDVELTRDELEIVLAWAYYTELAYGQDNLPRGAADLRARLKVARGGDVAASDLHDHDPADPCWRGCPAQR